MEGVVYLDSCSSCGAARVKGAERCELCGTSLRVSGEPETDSDHFLSGAKKETCSSCGHENPEDALFCNQCGTQLADKRYGSHRITVPGDVATESVSSEAVNTRPSSEVGRRALLIIGAAVAIVVGLYLLSSWLSNRPEPISSDEMGESVEVRDEIPALPDTLQQVADAFAAENTAEGWFEAGRYYLTQSWETQQSDPASSVLWARRAMDYFERSLAIEDTPDVRLAVAEAASLERSDPMRPVQEIQTILAEYPDHIGANLMLGERRVMIGRYEEAVEAFEKVLEVAPEGDPRRVAAEQFLTETRGRLSGDG